MKELACEEVSCTSLVRLFPSELSDVTAAVRRRLVKRLLKYWCGLNLNGVLISFSDVKILGNCGRITDDRPEIPIPISFSALVFRPELNKSKLYGQVQADGTSAAHIALIVNGVFNATIPAENLPEEVFVYDHETSRWTLNSEPLYSGSILRFTATGSSVDRGVEQANRKQHWEPASDGSALHIRGKIEATDVENCVVYRADTDECLNASTVLSAGIPDIFKSSGLFNTQNTKITFGDDGELEETSAAAPTMTKNTKITFDSDSENEENETAAENTNEQKDTAMTEAVENATENSTESSTSVSDEEPKTPKKKEKSSAKKEKSSAKKGEKKAAVEKKDKKKRKRDSDDEKASPKKSKKSKTK